MHHLFVLVYPLLFALGTQVEQVNCIFDQLLFNAPVEPRVCLEAWGLVHFDDPWFEVLVDQNVEAKDLEAELVL